MAEKLKQGLCTKLEGWDGEGDGRETQKGGDICTPMADSGCYWQKTTKFCKAIILQKINWKKKKILLDMKKFIGKESAAPLKKTAVASIFRIG